MSPPPYINNEKDTLGYWAFENRYPDLFKNLIEDLTGYEKDAKLASDRQKDLAVIKQKIEALAKNILENGEIPRYPESSKDAKLFNALFEQGWHWLDSPWLRGENYMYCLIYQIFQESQFFKDFDYYSMVKIDSFVKSANAVSMLADRYYKIADSHIEVGSEEHSFLLHELLTTSLWGYATDLSLVTNVTPEELKKVQVAVADREKESLLINDTTQIWKQLSKPKDGRVDIVLDNSGFELYGDIVLALFLVDTNLAESVVFHPKSRPWFISDVMPHDFETILKLLEDSEKFPTNRDAIDKLVAETRKYFSSGKFSIKESAFWTTPYDFHELTPQGVGKEAFENLKGTKLAIFKGDMNYRKLTADYRWPKTTKFSEALGPLAKTGLPLASLRTVKSDVCVGLPEGKELQLNAQWKKSHPDEWAHGWLYSADYAVLSANI